MSEMLITFGMQLDGQRATRASNRLGALTVGPQGLLDILETQLGLVARQPCAAQRTATYRDCLAHCNNPLRFYHASFSADELGVAAALLAWRDDLYLHGWDGRVGADASQRLKDLAEIETQARAQVAPSMGQRLVNVAKALDSRRPPIKTVLLADAYELYPLAWKMVLNHLPNERLEIPEGTAQGFLRQLQMQLRQSIAGVEITPIQWQEDGTVQVVQAQTRVVAASWLSRSLGQDTPTLLVTGGEGGCLDGHLVGASQARHGLNGSSNLRPALQVLPLAMELLWAPTNYLALLQFLTHSISPIRLFARRHLAAKIASAPGLVGSKWEDALADIAAHYAADAPNVLASIGEWLNMPTFTADDGVPPSEVLVRVERLLNFFKARLGHQEPAHRFAAQAGYAQCEAAQDSLKTLHHQGVERLKPRQLQQVIEQATASGVDNPLLAAQVGAHLSVSRPGAAIEQADTVIWWHLSMPVLPPLSPWSKAERMQLADAGVALPDGATLLTQAARDWLRPILAANCRLILVLAPPQEESHPLWQMIEAVVQQPKVHILEELLHTPGPLCQAQASAPLPLRKRWWRLPSDTPFEQPEKASFSSLNLLLFNPYQWLLQYGAKIQASKSQSLSDGFLLNGSLTHRLAEHFFTRPDALSMSTTDFNSWFSTHFPRVVREEGAVLLMEGRGADLATLRHRALRALTRLRTHFLNAGITVVTSEQALAGRFEGGALGGSADLVLTTALGHRAIVDMKWSGGKKYPEQLKANRHLQLAIYAELLRQDSGSWPSVAYFILESARLLTPDDQTFRDSEQVPANPPSSTPQLWLSFTEAWKWRQAQQAKGLFEVALQSIEEDEDSIPPDQAMPMEYLNEAYNDYLALAGWEQ